MPRGGLTQIQFDEEQAHAEKHERERPKRPEGWKASMIPFMMLYSHQPGWGR